MYNIAVFVLLDLQTNPSTIKKLEIPSWQQMATRTDIFNVIYVRYTDHVRNEEVLLGVNEQRNILHEIRNGRLIGLVTSYVETAF